MTSSRFSSLFFVLRKFIVIYEASELCLRRPLVHPMRMQEKDRCMHPFPKEHILEYVCKTNAFLIKNINLIHDQTHKMRMLLFMHTLMTPPSWSITCWNVSNNVWRIRVTFKDDLPSGIISKLPWPYCFFHLQCLPLSSAGKTYPPLNPLLNSSSLGNLWLLILSDYFSPFRNAAAIKVADSTHLGIA